MNTATLLHFPIERTLSAPGHAKPTLNTLRQSPHPDSHVIPFPRNGKQPFKQGKTAIDLSSIQVNTRLYRAFHTQPPTGIRSWGFAIGNFTENFWVIGLPFLLAAEQARKEAQRLGAETVIVLP